MAGINIKNMVSDPDKLQHLLQQATDGSFEDFATGKFNMDTALMNRYVGNIPCHLKMGIGGEGSKTRGRRSVDLSCMECFMGRIGGYVTAACIQWVSNC